MTLLFLTIYLISTHALREEGDRMRWMEVLRSFYFYPRPPRGGRRHSRHRRYVFVLISTHALREEGDNFHPLGSAMRSIFLPTPSARRATLYNRLLQVLVTISTHALREEGDAGPILL